MISGIRGNHWDILLRLGWSIFQNTIDYVGFPPPTITNVSPTFGLNTSSVHATLTGYNFSTAAFVGLTKNFMIYGAATNITVNSPQTITCDFNLTGIEAGQWM